MLATDLGLEWVPQFDADTGGVSYPDIVVHLPSGNRALIDITSQRGHILGKGGAWCTSVNYVYVAEVWFPSVYRDHLPQIARNVAAGGVDQEHLERMMVEVDALRRARKATRDQELSEAREERGRYGSYASFVKEVFDGDKTAAGRWMRAHGMGDMKGVTRKAGRRRLDYAQKAKKRREAVKARRAKMTPEERRAEKRRIRDQAQHRKRARAIADKRAARRARREAEDEELEGEGEVAVAEDDESLELDDDAGMEVGEDTGSDADVEEEEEDL